ELLRKSESDLERMRSQYFPLIKSNVITGYNIYPIQFGYPEDGLSLHYLHAYLRMGDKHFRELFERLAREAQINLEGRIFINNNLIDRANTIPREADYITDPGWKDPPGTRYFDFDGNEIPSERAKRLKNKLLIGEGLQYDLMIKAIDELELRRLVDVFKKYASEDQLDMNGRKIRDEEGYKENELAISEAWDAPLLFYTNNTPKDMTTFPDFVPVTQFIIPEQLNGKPVIVSTLVAKKTKEFHRTLKRNKIRPKTDRRHVLRAFVEDYLDKS
ncbi:MAG: hypothetical protein AABW87_01060, partial [Nanoarchaeota archaeon]